MMKISMILVIIIGIFSLIGTLLLGGKSDEDYRSATKGNLSRLTLIYVILILVLLIGIGIYIML
jgi:predicted transporter